jgi:hypothetical protein
MYKVLICGSRFYTHYGKVLHYIRRLKATSVNGDIVIIAGGARGADTLAVKAAIACGLPFREYPAQWEKYGKKAGPIRNQTMVDMETPDIVVAFHENIDGSKGTKDMVSRARKSGVPVVVFN